MSSFTINNTGPAGASSLISWRGDNLGGGTDGYFLPLWYGAASMSVEDTSKIIVPSNGTLRNLFIIISSTTAGNITFTVRVNGSDTSLTGTITAGNLTTNNTGNTVSVHTSDIISLKTQTTIATSANTVQPTVVVEFGL